MDFSIQYTNEQEEFRTEVRAWMEENAKVPEELGPIPLESGHPRGSSFGNRRVREGHRVRPGVCRGVCRAR